jgi:hypothetical protein
MELVKRFNAMKAVERCDEAFPADVMKCHMVILFPRNIYRLVSCFHASLKNAIFKCQITVALLL